MLKLQNKKPIVYNHPLSHLITSIAYIDEIQSVPRSVINYLIKSEQAQMEDQKIQYLQDFKMPDTPIINSQRFAAEVQRIQSKQKQPKKNLAIPEVKLTKDLSEIENNIKQGILNNNYNYLRNINTDIATKFGPMILKEQISTLDKVREAIQKNIRHEEKEIEQLNAKRRYEQLESKQRLDTIKDRIKMLLNKDESINYTTMLGPKKVKMQ